MTRSACLNAIYELAQKDERVVFIGSDLSANTLIEFKRDFPDRFFMEGIQEQNIISMAAGLAMEGFIPYVNTIATFLTRRAYEQIAVDVCMHNLPVRLIGNGGGLLYAPLGPTHMAVEDIAIMRSLPNMSVVCCSDSEEMKAFMPKTLDYPGPMYIRLGKDNDPVIDFPPQEDEFEISNNRVAYLSKEREEILIYSTGIMTSRAVEVAKLLEPLVSVIHIATIKPLSEQTWVGLQNDPVELFVTIEEGVRNGGLGTAVLEALKDANVNTPALRLGLPDAFPHHYGEQDDLLDTYGLTPEKMAKRIKEFYATL